MGRLCSTNQMYSIGTNMAACSSFCCLFMSAITNYWLCTMERTPLENGTWIYLTVYSGLWKRCTQDRKQPIYLKLVLPKTKFIPVLYIDIKVVTWLSCGCHDSVITHRQPRDNLRVYMDACAVRSHVWRVSHVVGTSFFLNNILG